MEIEQFFTPYSNRKYFEVQFPKKKYKESFPNLI